MPVVGSGCSCLLEYGSGMYMVAGAEQCTLLCLGNWTGTMPASLFILDGHYTPPWSEARPAVLLPGMQYGCAS
jgi:hypothetical protein